MYKEKKVIDMMKHNRWKHLTYKEMKEYEDFHKIPFYAIDWGKKELIEILLKNGYDMHKTNNTHETPLHFAIRDGSIEIAKLLIEYETDFSIEDLEGDTVLANAAYEGHVELAELILKKNPPLHVENMGGHTPFGVIANRYIVQFDEKKHLPIAMMLINAGYIPTEEEMESMSKRVGDEAMSRMYKEMLLLI